MKKYKDIVTAIEYAEKEMHKVAKLPKHIVEILEKEEMKLKIESDSWISHNELNKILIKQLDYENAIERIHRKHVDKYTFGEKWADRISESVGSWRFIILFLLFLFAWMNLNLILGAKAFDPFPFILLNLLLSTIAAIQAPIIMMSQNRAADIDRRKAKEDYEIERAQTKLMLRELKKIREEIRKK